MQLEGEPVRQRGALQRVRLLLLRQHGRRQLPLLRRGLSDFGGARGPSHWGGPRRSRPRRGRARQRGRLLGGRQGALPLGQGRHVSVPLFRPVERDGAAAQRLQELEHPVLQQRGLLHHQRAPEHDLLQKVNVARVHFCWCLVPVFLAVVEDRASVLQHIAEQRQAHWPLEERSHALEEGPGPSQEHAEAHRASHDSTLHSVEAAFRVTRIQGFRQAQLGGLEELGPGNMADDQRSQSLQAGLGDDVVERGIRGIPLHVSVDHVQRGVQAVRGSRASHPQRMQACRHKVVVAVGVPLIAVPVEHLQQEIRGLRRALTRRISHEGHRQWDGLRDEILPEVAEVIGLGDAPLVASLPIEFEESVQARPPSGLVR
mmetsp:Transcript_20038/g.56308  ORF Transcript_20038/g.56308 Transcript_20038/m.56308 type:complete len:372 (-) Transcript_20038:1643-2758(-)